MTAAESWACFGWEKKLKLPLPLHLYGVATLSILGICVPDPEADDPGVGLLNKIGIPYF